MRRQASQATPFDLNALQLTNRGVWHILSDMIRIGKFKAKAVDILIFSGALVNLAVIALILVKYLF